MLSESVDMNSFLSLSLADLHCDTAYELFRQKKHMGDPTLAVDFDSSPYRTYLQAMAVMAATASTMRPSTMRYTPKNLKLCRLT